MKETTLEEARKENPFVTCIHDGKAYFHVDVASRLHAIKLFNEDQLQTALNAPFLQTTVRKAIECRLRKLRKGKV